MVNYDINMSEYPLRSKHMAADEVAAHRKKVREFIARAPFRRTSLEDKDLDLYCEALTHDSYCRGEAVNIPGLKAPESYERLEFLGDAVLEFIACEYVYLNSELREGKMTDFKQEIVRNKNISDRVLSYGLDIDSAMLVSHGHRNGSKNLIEENMRADSFEALIGATYILCGMDEAKRIVHEVLIDQSVNAN